jgi:hypothetical protein
MQSAVAVQHIGVGPCRVEKFGDVLVAMAHITPTLPNEAMARIAPRSLMMNNKNFHSTQATVDSLD